MSEVFVKVDCLNTKSLKKDLLLSADIFLKDTSCILMSLVGLIH